MDSHNTQRYVDAAGHVRNEGDVQVAVAGPYPVGYRAIVPKAASAFNRILAHHSSQNALPSNFTPRGCGSVGGAEVCIFARDGGCDADAAATFEINDVLTRAGL